MTLWEWAVIGMLFAFVLYKLKQYSRCITLITNDLGALMEDATRPVPRTARKSIDD